jgi:hypothetical protein
MSDELVDESESREEVAEDTALPPVPAGAALPASLALAVLVTTPLHLSALRGEGSVTTAAIGLLVAFAGALALSALATWMVSAVDGDVPRAVGGNDGDDGDRRIVSC